MNISTWLRMALAVSSTSRLNRSKLYNPRHFSWNPIQNLLLRQNLKGSGYNRFSTSANRVKHKLEFFGRNNCLEKSMLWTNNEKWNKNGISTAEQITKIIEMIIFRHTLLFEKPENQIFFCDCKNNRNLSQLCSLSLFELAKIYVSFSCKK